MRTKLSLMFFFILSACKQHGVEETSIDVAIITGKCDKIEKLVKNGSNPNFSETEGITPLSRALTLKKLECVERLLENGADVNLLDETRNEYQIFRAIRTYDIEFVKVLVKHGANVNAKNSVGRTPIMTAIVLSQYDIAYYLVEKGAKLSITDNFGHSALDKINNNAESLTVEQAKYKDKLLAVVNNSPDTQSNLLQSFVSEH